MSSPERQALIRRHFDAVRDITWAENLEPKFKAEGIDAASIKGIREDWNQFTETRDWEWWQKESAADSLHDIYAMMSEAVKRAESLGLTPPEVQRNEQPTGAGAGERSADDYRQRLADASTRVVSDDKERGVDR